MEAKLKEDIKQLLTDCDAGQRKRQWREMWIRATIAAMAIFIWESGGCAALGRQAHDAGYSSGVHGSGAGR